jgi:hypothetical protein
MNADDCTSSQCFAFSLGIFVDFRDDGGDVVVMTMKKLMMSLVMVVMMVVIIVDLSF